MFFSVPLFYGLLLLQSLGVTVVSDPHANLPLPSATNIQYDRAVVYAEDSVYDVVNIVPCCFSRIVHSTW